MGQRMKDHLMRKFCFWWVAHNLSKSRVVTFVTLVTTSENSRSFTSTKSSYKKAVSAWVMQMLSFCQHLLDHILKCTCIFIRHAEVKLSMLTMVKGSISWLPDFASLFVMLRWGWVCKQWWRVLYLDFPRPDFDATQQYNQLINHSSKPNCRLL